MCLSQIPVASHRKECEKIPICVLAKCQLHLIEKILDNPKLCLSQIPIASYRKYSKSIPNCVVAKFQLQLIENILRHIQDVSQPKSNRF